MVKKSEVNSAIQGRSARGEFDRKAVRFFPTLRGCLQILSFLLLARAAHYCKGEVVLACDFRELL